MIENYLKAGYPALCIITSEPHRAHGVVQCDGWRFYSWDCLTGISEAEATKPIDEIRDPVEAIRWLDNYRDTVLMANNLHLFLDIPEVIQAIQNGVIKWKATGSCLVMISPIINLPQEVQKLFTVIDMPLPDDEELFQLQCDIGRDCNIEPNRKAAVAAKGLTLWETENAYSLSAVEKNRFSSDVISKAKEQILLRSGLLQTWSPEDIANVGGLGQLKTFIRNRSKAFDDENCHLPKLKAILLVGVPGTGKSLSSKATASLLGWPLIRLDISSLKNSLVGESERRMRESLKIIDAYGQAVIWVDEVEKVFAGVNSSNDSGTSAAMFGTFLTWMQETTSPILIMCTANNIEQLPPELIRRFCSIMFVDIPTATEREEIINIMNRKYGSNIPVSFVEKLAGWTGCEIEKLAKESLFSSVEQAYSEIVPISRTMKEQVHSLQRWAKTRARLANTPEPEAETNRKVRGPKVNTVNGPSNPLLN